MKTTVCTLIGVVMLTALAVGAGATGDHTELLQASGEVTVGKPAPPFGGWNVRKREVLSLDDLLKPKSDAPSKAVVISFFATWCKPCKEGLPIVAAVQKELAAEGLRTALIATGEDGDGVAKFLDGLGLDLPTMGDKFDSVSKRYGIVQAAVGSSVSKQVPRTFVMDSNGTVRGIIAMEGPDFKDVLIRLVREAAK